VSSWVSVLSLVLTCLAPVVPTFLSRLAACLSIRLPPFSRRSEKRHTQRLTNLTLHIRIAAAARLLSIVSTFLARLAARLLGQGVASQHHEG
jgi:hypothetical protein